MSSIPLPALAIQQPQQQQQQTSPLENIARVLQVKQALQNVQEGQQNLQARQALNQAYAQAYTTGSDGQPKFDADKLQASLATGPAAYQTPAVMKNIADFQTARLDVTQKTQAIQAQSQDMLGSAAAAIKSAGYDPAIAHSLLDTLPQTPQTAQLRQQIDNPPALHQLVDTAIQNSPKQRELGAAETTANARATAAQTEANKFAASQNPQSPMYAPTAASVALGTAPGASGIVAGEAQQAGVKAGAEAKARLPYDLAQKRADQAITDGDPNAAGQLLINGDVAPSQIISSRKPEFAVKAFQAAHDLSGGSWNAQSAEANFKVANSPSNLAFFGSAKSLTDRGGTLDQLAQIGTTIPQGQFRALNSIADWENAATGKGPIAEYATKALGVADDYAKVMGGGVGTDSSRLQILNSIAASASPDARAGALNGIRGSVNSQVTSRIGKNPVLQRIYGSDQPAAPQLPPEGTVKTNAAGDKIVVKGGQWQIQ